MIGDIPLPEEQAPLYIRPRIFRRINEFMNDNEAQAHTRFKKGELHRILNLFQLPPVIHVARNDGNFYQFHSEELLIFTLIKMSTGYATTFLCDYMGYASDARMGLGYKWLVEYLDGRYHHLIGPNGMNLWCWWFPSFADKIWNYICKVKLKYNPLTGMWQLSPGVWFDPGTFNV